MEPVGLGGPFPQGLEEEEGGEKDEEGVEELPQGLSELSVLKFSYLLFISATASFTGGKSVTLFILIWDWEDKV